MSRAYTPSLTINPSLTIERTRELPIKGVPLVQVGDLVNSESAVLEAELPGELLVIRLPERLGLEPDELIPYLKVVKGSEVVPGTELVSVPGIFGYFKSTVTSPCHGVVDYFTPTNAHLGIRLPSEKLRTLAYISGEVIKVEASKRVTIRSHAALIQGVFGIGGERSGTLFKLPIRAEERISQSVIESVPSPSGKVLVGGGGIDVDALRLAGAIGISGILSGSISSATLGEYLGYELGVTVTGSEKIPLTLIISEGFGSLPISERILDLASQHNSKAVSISGATQVRAGAVRPELIISNLHHQTNIINSQDTASKPGLEIGAQVRLIRIPYFGQYATITELPPEPEIIATGARMRVLRARLKTGEIVTVPRANVELF